MPFIDRDGVILRYESHGRGPAILLSHGYGATMRMWDRQVAAFADRYRIILWDMRGHGWSGDPANPNLYSRALSVGDMAAILDSCGVDRVVLGGLSLGGILSLAFHLAFPERVRGLMLFDTGPGFRNDAARQAWNDRVKARARALELRGLSALERGKETSMGCHRSALGLACAARGMLTQHDAGLIDALPSIAVPTLVLAGSEDTDFLAAAEYMAAKIPGARRVVIPGAGHASNLDRPQAFNKAMRDFLDGATALAA